MPVAPNVLAQIRTVFAAHPEIDAMKDGERGQLTTLVVQALGGFPWGRKEKAKGTGVLADDALCYRLQDNRFEIYDIQRGFNPGDLKVPNVDVAGFDYKGTFADGENGYFYTVSSAPTGPTDPPNPPHVPAPDIAALVREEVAKALQRVAIRSSRGHYLRDDWSSDRGMFDRTDAGEGELYRLEPKS